MASEYHGTDGDLRNLYRRGSGLTPRRLLVLLQGLHWWEAWLEMEVGEQQKAMPDLIRERKAAFEARQQRAREATPDG